MELLWLSIWPFSLTTLTIQLQDQDFLIIMQVDIAIPEVFVGGLLGSMLIFLFSAWACAAVGRTAQEVVNEVRRQFIERPGIMVSRITFQKVALCCRILMERLKLMHNTFTGGRNIRRSQIMVDVCPLLHLRL